VSKLSQVKVALVGVGNCSSAFVQGLNYYADLDLEENSIGLQNPSLGGMIPSDIHIVAAFDIDEEKVGKELSEAIFSGLNNAPKVANVLLTGVIVSKGPVLDGISKGIENKIKVSNAPIAEVSKILKETGADVVINLLPSGAVEASKWYAKQSLDARCGFVNATPCFIASDPTWVKRFEDFGLPLVGDDLIDQVGSTSLHKTLLNLLSKNGVKITETYQLDVGGGAESMDTHDRSRKVKRNIKTEAVASALPYEAEIVAGSTDYVDFLKNKRDSYFWISGKYFCNTPMKIDLKFSTVDAPNAGSVLFDVSRAMKLAMAKKLKGAIIPICAYAFKKIPKNVPIENIEKTFRSFIKENS
jgi:myo-inositol-1-phosphate synthase